MADRPGDPDAALVREAIASNVLSVREDGSRSATHENAAAALDRLVARLSEAEAKIAWNAEHRSEVVQLERERREEVERRLSVYEQALPAIEGAANWIGGRAVMVPGSLHHQRALLDVLLAARAALTTEPGQEASGG